MIERSELVSMLDFCTVETESTCMKQMFGFWCWLSQSAFLMHICPKLKYSRKFEQKKNQPTKQQKAQ